MWEGGEFGHWRRDQGEKGWNGRIKNDAIVGCSVFWRDRCGYIFIGSGRGDI